jgi:hypothetical protein
VTTCVCGPEVFVPVKEKKLTGQLKQGLDALHTAMAQRGETLTAGEIPFLAVKLEVWRDVAKQNMLWENDGAFRTAFSRCRGKLVEDGHVAFRGDYVWPTQPRPLGDVPF